MIPARTTLRPSIPPPPEEPETLSTTPHLAVPHLRAPLFALIGLLVGLPAAAEETGTVPQHPRAVVELFTSQGCARCPPADALLGRLSEDPDLVALTFAVDYWDYLGWKDTAARPEFSRRQRAYADRRGDHDVYTPQMVINGRVHVVGSDHAGIDRRLGALAAERHDLVVPIDVATTADALVVDVGAATGGDAAAATVWLVRFDRRRTVPVKRGENTGLNLTYTHLVRSLQPIGMWKGRPLRIELPRNGTVEDAGTGCAVLLQVDRDGSPGPILGARLVDRPQS